MIRKSKINKNYKKDSLKNLSNIEIILNFIMILICIIFNIYSKMHKAKELQKPDDI